MTWPLGNWFVYILFSISFAKSLEGCDILYVFWEIPLQSQIKFNQCTCCTQILVISHEHIKME